MSAEHFVRPIIRMREHPDVAVIVLSGIVVPPHQRLMHYQVHQGAPENVNVSSRGTSKSSTICVVAASVVSVLYAKKRIIELSATGFRGGQLIFSDVDRWAQGKWDAQEPDIDLVARSFERGAQSKSLIHKAQNFWEIAVKSHSVLRTLPTNDEDRIRGERAHLVFVDEANTTDEGLIQRVVKPFLNVKGGFDTGGADATSNQAFYTSTIDYSWRPFMSVIAAAKEGLRRDYEAMKAAQRKDWDTYHALETKGLLQYTYVSVDYTDTMIREELVDRNGRRYKVRYPNANALLGRPKLEFRTFPRGIPFSERDEKGHIKREGSRVRALTTYPIDNDTIERALHDGSTEEAIWLAEQRNVIDTATGDVYPHGLLETIASTGDKVIIPWEDCGPDWQRLYAGDVQRGFTAPIMYECSDPCVLGVDVANSNRDFAAFNVIRIGPLAQGDFNPVTGLGKTDWSNVIWAEQHRMMSAKDIADKIRAFRERYNLVYYHEPWKEDGEWCRAIGCDDKGGGSAVRDSLVHIDLSDDQLNPSDQRLYDPLDSDPRIRLFAGKPNCVPMVDMINASDVLNEKLVEFSLAQMKVGRLYLPKWLEESRRPERDAKLDPGYIGARILLHQLGKLQQEPTARARKFFMAGDTNDVTNKRDAWAAFMYACKQLRAHLIRIQRIDHRPPAMGSAVAKVNKRRGYGGRAPGSKY